MRRWLSCLSVLLLVVVAILFRAASVEAQDATFTVSTYDSTVGLNDTTVYLPPNYYSFVPPPARSSYFDQIFGTTIYRISDAAHTVRADTGGLLPSVEAEYPTKSPFNADNTKILLLEFGYFAVYDGVTLQRIKPLCCPAPAGPTVSSSSEPLWSRTDPNTFYYHANGGNQLIKYTLGTNGGPDTSIVIHTFSEYGSIYAQGESEISNDGDHVVLVGDGRYVFVYTISTNTKGPVFDTSVGGGWDSVYISPNNNVLISWNTNGTGRYQGEELYDTNMTFLRRIANNDGHKVMTRDIDGSEVLLQTNSADPTPIPNCSNGIVKINLATAAQTCIFQPLNWSLATHVTAPTQNGWAFVETYNGSSAASPWYTYTNELVQVKLDGTQYRRLVQHRSNTATYDGQPHISVSRDGSRFTFNSNMMGSVTDVYEGIVPSGLSAPSISTTSLPSATQNVAYSTSVTATGGTTPYSWSITSGSLPAGLTLASGTGLISGTPTTTGTTNFTIQVVDANALVATQNLSIIVSLPAPVAISPTSLQAASQNTAYSATLMASGGAAPYTWSIASGSLPAGLALVPNGNNTAVLSGIPTGTGTSSFTLQVSASGAPSGNQPLSITVNSVVSNSITSSISTVQSNAVSGSNVWSVAVPFKSGNTPGNLIVAFVRMATVSQTVTVTDSAHNVYVDAVSQVQSSDNHQVHIFYAKSILGGANTVTAAFPKKNGGAWVAIYEFSGASSTNPLDQTAHAQGSDSSPFTGLITTTGANELAFAASGLPSSYTGTVSTGSGYTMLLQNGGGAPADNEGANTTTPGQYGGKFNLSSNANWSAVVATFKPAPVVIAAPAIITSALPSGTQNTSYSTTITASGGTPPFSWTIVSGSGSLPAGLTLGSSTTNSVAISGTPTMAGTSSFTVQVRDANSLTVAKALTITVIGAPSITTSSLSNGTQNTAYSATVAASGGTGPFLWTIVAGSGSLPSGLALGSSATNTITISGTPTTAGTSSFTIQVTDANSLSATKALTIAVNSAGTVTRVEQNNTAITYAGPWAGTWYTINGSSYSGGSAAEAMDGGSTATLAFTGTGVSWIGYKDPWSGIAQVYLDGTLVAQVDTYSASTVTQAVPYTVSGLVSGTHQLMIKATGQKNSLSGGSWVWVDAFDVRP